METVSAVKVVTAKEAVGEPLPPRVQQALGQLVGAAKEGLLALSVGVGLGVLAELMEDEVDEVVGPKGKHDADRSAVRHGHEDGEAVRCAPDCRLRETDTLFRDAVQFVGRRATEPRQTGNIDG